MGPKSAPPAKGNLKGKKTTPKKQKQPLPIPERLKRLFTSLCAQIDGGHFANAIKTCDKILKVEPDDQDALQTKLFLLLQTDQYATALALVEDNGEHNFERLYSLYRLHKEEEVESALAELKETNGGDDRGIIHLEAQLNYRQGSYQTAFDLYNELLDTAEPDTEEHSDVLTNLEATQKHLDFINSGYTRALSVLPVTVTSNLESLPPPVQVQPTSILAAAVQPPSLSSEQKKPENTSAGTGTGTPVPQKKVRAKRVPKGVVPGVTPPPDPERWLKKSERTSSYTGHRRRKGGAGGGGATQGAVESVGAVAASGGGGGGGGGGKSKGKKKK